MLPHNERKWVGPIITLIRGPKWVDCIPSGPEDLCMRPCIASDWPAIKHRGAGKPCLPVGLIADKVRGVEVSRREQEWHWSRSWWQTRLLGAFVAAESVWKGISGNSSAKNENFSAFIHPCNVKQNVTAAFHIAELQKEQIKHRMTCANEFSSSSSQHIVLKQLYRKWFFQCYNFESILLSFRNKRVQVVHMAVINSYNHIICYLLS